VYKIGDTRVRDASFSSTNFKPNALVSMQTFQTRIRKCPMLLTISTTHHPATDLGFLLHKHPDRVNEKALAFGRAVVLFPEANEDRCQATLMLQGG
jgi:hypothetical protein